MQKLHTLAVCCIPLLLKKLSLLIVAIATHFLGSLKVASLWLVASVQAGPGTKFLNCDIQTQGAVAQLQAVRDGSVKLRTSAPATVVNFSPFTGTFEIMRNC